MFKTDAGKYSIFTRPSRRSAELRAAIRPRSRTGAGGEVCRNVRQPKHYRWRRDCAACGAKAARSRPRGWPDSAQDQCGSGAVKTAFAALVLAAFAVAAAAQNEEAFNAKQRIQRIHDLGKKDARAIPALAQYLRDSNREIRIEAVKAIVKIGTEASLAPLAAATHDNDSEVQIRATDGIVNFYLPGYIVKGGLTGPLVRGVRQVKDFFSSRNDQVVDPDVTIRPDVAQALAEEVRGGAGSDVRANAALAAGLLRDQSAVPSLSEALPAKESDVIF